MMTREGTGSMSMSVATSQQANQRQDDDDEPAVAFLDLLVKEEGGEWWIKRRHQLKYATTKTEDQKVQSLSKEDKLQVVRLKKRLADVGRELLMTLPELNVSMSSKKTPHSIKVRLLQLQLMCRMLCFGTLTSTKTEEKKILKKEIRGLLDRIALLLDAANPPSLAEEDADECSPFQVFLQQKLRPRLQTLFPGLVQYLMKAYELEEANGKAKQDVKSVMNSMLPTPVLQLSQSLPELPSSAITVNKSILSALRQERPVKRACPDASKLFKEVELPYGLQQKQLQSYSRKSRRVRKSHSSSADKSSRDTLLGVAGTEPIKAIGTTQILTSRLSDGTDTLRRAAARTSTAPRRVMFERSCIVGRKSAIALSSCAAIQVGLSASGRIQSASISGSTLRRTISTSSVVMRTPDRPKRLGARSTRRILVEASPPLRRSDEAGTALPRLLQPKSSRPGANPPLFG